MKNNGWTPERCKQQAQAIQRWRPWERSTGPCTPEGKVVASRNSWQGGLRPMLRLLERALRTQRHNLQEKFSDKRRDSRSSLK